MSWERLDRRGLLGGAAVAAGGLLASGTRVAAMSPSVSRSGESGGGDTVGAAAATGALSTYLLLTPVRVYDSRPKSAPDGTDPTTGATDVKWLRGSQSAIDVRYVLGSTATPTGVPASAAGVLMNITVTRMTGGGWLVAWAEGSPRPTTTNVNWAATSGVVNSLVMSRCADGYVSLYTMLPVGASVEVIVDVIGWLE